jgi:heme a synthase
MRTTPLQGLAQTAPGAPVRAWLGVVCAMIFVMVVLGGVTRLTDSGLSIVDWAPVSGVLPPLSHADWQALFDAYKRTPQFRDTNFWMGLGDFQAIYWMEYVHRLWGRLIGIAFAVPLAWFAVRGQLRGRLGGQLGIALLLGAGQGALGWYMVASGLVDRPSVSHYRLAAHLMLAVAIYGWLLWIWLGLGRNETGAPPSRGRGFALLLLCWIMATMSWGAFTAGLHAGQAYNTFPSMGGYLVPPEAFTGRPLALDLVANPAAVQFVHRCLAISFVVLALGFWVWSQRAGIAGSARAAAASLGGMAVLQAALGIATLLTGVALPLAATHQAGALVTFSLAVWCVYAFRPARGR